jgi:hypothetical protein
VPYYYGRSPLAHQGFWGYYPWNPAVKSAPLAPSDVSNGYSYSPRPRTTPFASAAAPTGFGYVPVIVAAGTGAILGAKLSRSGSWNRASSGS